MDHNNKNTDEHIEKKMKMKQMIILVRVLV